MAYAAFQNTFHPYSFDEMLKPLAIYSQEYARQEAGLTELGAQAALWKDKLDPKLDKEAYDRYTQYTADLEKQTNALLSSGLTPTTRKNLIQLTKRYQSEIAPLEEAQTKLNAELAKRAQAGDGIVYQKSDLRIGDFLGGKTPNTTSVDLSKLQARTADKAARLGAALYSDPEWSKVNSQYYQIYTANGIPYDVLQLVLSGELESNPNISPELKEKARAFADVANNELNAVEYGKYESPEQAKLQNAVYSGLYAGLAKPTYKYEADRGYETPSQAQARRQSSALFNWQYQTDPRTGAITGYNDDYLKSVYAQKGYNYDPATGTVTKVGSSSSSSSSGGGGGTDYTYQNKGVYVYSGKEGKTQEIQYDNWNQHNDSKNNLTTMGATMILPEDLSERGLRQALKYVGIETNVLDREGNLVPMTKEAMLQKLRDNKTLFDKYTFWETSPGVGDKNYAFGISPKAPIREVSEDIVGGNYQFPEATVGAYDL